MGGFLRGSDPYKCHSTDCQEESLTSDVTLFGFPTSAEGEFGRRRLEPNLTYLSQDDPSIAPADGMCHIAKCFHARLSCMVHVGGCLPEGPLIYSERHSCNGCVIATLKMGPALKLDNKGSALTNA